MNELAWTAFFAVTGVVFAAIVATQRNPKYIAYGIFGSLYAGFLFDPLSMHRGYYTFNFGPQIMGIPITVTIAEAFCVGIIIFAFERITKLIKK